MSADAKKSAKPGPATAKDAKKKGGFNPILLLVPVALVAALVLAFTLPPTHALLVNGPLKPLFARLGVKPAGVLAKATPDPAAEVKRLNEAVESGKRDAAAKDARIAALQSQVTGLQGAAASPTPAAKPSAAPVTDDVKRAATYWAGMDAEKAAAVVALLPDDYVKLVFSQMPADAVADIMSTLPAKRAARLTSSADGAAH